MAVLLTLAEQMPSGSDAAQAGITIAVLALIGTGVTAVAAVIVAFINRPRTPPVTTSTVNDELVREVVELLVEERERNREP